MTVQQTVQISTYDYGASLTDVRVRDLVTDAEVRVAASANEISTDAGIYLAVFTHATTVIAAGDYLIRAVISGRPLNMYVTFAGVDGEVVTARNERVAVLDSATQAVLASKASQSSIDAMQTDVDGLLSYGSSLTASLAGLIGKFTGITLLAKWLGALAGKSTDAPTLAEINATPAGATFNNVTDSEQAIRDHGDAAWGGGGSGGSQSITLQLGATIPLTLGQVTGLTQDLVVGNSYTQELGTRIPVTLTDQNGDAVATDFGNRSLSDSTCTIKCVLHPANARNTDNVTAAAQGVCEFVPVSGMTPASLWIELPKSETDRLSPGVYAVQFHAEWNDGERVTLAWKGTCKFVRIIKPKT